MTDFIRDDNGYYHIANGTDDFVRNPNGYFHLEPSGSSFNNDGTEVLKAKSINSDNSKIKTDGDGNLTVGGNVVVDGDLTVLNSKSITIWPSATGIPGATLLASGSATLEIGTTNGGLGELTCGVVDATGESHFYKSTFTDPDSGISRDAKFGQDGIAVHGGIKTDTLYATSKVIIDPSALPTSDPKVKGQIWNNGGALYISLG